MNTEVFSALSRNIGKLRDMEKAHEDMAIEIALLRLENTETRSMFNLFGAFESYFEFLVRLLNSLCLFNRSFC